MISYSFPPVYSVIQSDQTSAGSVSRSSRSLQGLAGNFLSRFPSVNIFCEVQPSVLATASGDGVQCWLACVQDLGRRNGAVTTHWSDVSLLRLVFSKWFLQGLAEQLKMTVEL